jgi:hypothetical protein
LDLTDLDGWKTAFIAAEEYAQIVVSSLGFSLGLGYSVEIIQVTEESVEIIQVTEEDGTPHVFGVQPLGYQADQTLSFNPYLEVFNSSLLLASKNLFFRLAIRDYLRAITDTTDCAHYCYRAIEGIKAAFAFETGNDAWAPMHAALGTDQSSIEQKIKTYADPLRHGNWAEAKPTDSSVRWKMLSLTKDILSRYLDYAKPS